MIKPTWKQSIAVMLLACGFAAVATPLQAAVISDAAVEALTNTYAEALRSGDLTLLESVSGGELLDKRKPLWGNPEYGEELRQTYANSTFSIVEVEKDKVGTATVKLQVQSAGGLPMFRELTIADPDDSGNYRIIGESAVAR